jgi:protein disulfide-isomerase
VLAGIILGVTIWGRGRVRSSRGGFFKVDEKDGLLGGVNAGGKVD